MDECEQYELYGSTTGTKDDGLTDWFDIQPTFGISPKDMPEPSSKLAPVDPNGEENTINSFYSNEGFENHAENVLTMWQEADQELHQKLDDEIQVFRNNVFSLLAEQRIQCEFLFGLIHPDFVGKGEELDLDSHLHIVPQRDELPRATSNDSMSDTSVHTYYEPSDQSFESDGTVRYSGAVGAFEDLNRMALRTLTLSTQIYRRLSQLYVAA